MGLYVREPLDPSLRSLEVSRRQRLSAVAQVFGEMEARVRTQLASSTPRPPFCPNLFDVETGGPGAARNRRIAPRDDGFRFDPRLDPSGTFAIFSGIISTPFGDFRLSDLCQVPGDGDAPTSVFAELWRRLRTAGGYPLDAVIDGASQLPIELLGGMAELSETLGVRGALALERLGPVPDVDIRKGLFVEGTSRSAAPFGHSPRRDLPHFERAARFCGQAPRSGIRGALRAGAFPLVRGAAW